MKVFGPIILVVFVISAIFTDSSSGSEQQFQGTCPQVEVQRDLNKDEYAGRWFEIKRFVNKLITGECGDADYLQTKYGYNVTYSSRNMAEQDTSTIEIIIEKEIVKSPFAKYDLYYNCLKDFSHHILETDYKTYSIVWSCQENEDKNANIQRLFIYSRGKTLDQASMNKIIEVLTKNKIDHTKLEDVEQDDKTCSRNEEQP